jgi:hypothetical protein
MKTSPPAPSTALAPLFQAWLALVALTLLSLGLGQWLHGADWLPLLVAAIVWLKGRLICRHFIETQIAHAYVARVLAGFIAATPLALVLVVFLGPRLLRWLAL